MPTKLTGRALQRLFPGLFARLQAAAAAGGPRGHLARAMQRMESGVVIGGAAATLAGSHPVVPFVTIHDAGYARGFLPVRWGFVPRRAKSATDGQRPVNAKTAPARSPPAQL